MFFRVLSFYINSKCNLSCEYCYMKNSMFNEEVTDEVLEKFILEAPKTKFNQIAILGGESMLSPHIIERLVKGLGDRFCYQIMTNGTIDIEPLIERLQEYKHLFSFNISYDGINQKLRKEDTDKLIKANIETAKKHGVKVNIISVLSQNSVNNLVENMLYLSKTHNNIKIKRMCSMATIWSKEELNNFINQIDKMVDVATFTRIENNVIWGLPNHIQYPKEQNGIVHPGFACQYFKDNWEVCGMDGKMYPCDLCYADKIECFGEIGNADTNKFLDKNFVHHRDDILYNVCSYANIQVNGNHLDNTNTVAWEVDEALDKAREKYQRRLNQLWRLKNENNR